VAGNKQVMLGEKDEYVPLCRSCYQKAMIEKLKAVYDSI